MTWSPSTDYGGRGGAARPPGCAGFGRAARTLLSRGRGRRAVRVARARPAGGVRWSVDRPFWIIKAHIFIGRVPDAPQPPSGDLGLHRAWSKIVQCPPHPIMRGKPVAPEARLHQAIIREQLQAA